jgi:hypothetical protein
MRAVSEIDAIREKAILSSLAGFPFLLVFGCAWIVAGALTYVFPADIAPWVYVFAGIPAAPIAIMLDRRLGYVPASNPDPLLPLTLQILFVQVVAFPAIMLVADSAFQYIPVAFAAIVGAHFLPFDWVYKTKLYTILGIAVSAGSFMLALFVGEAAMHYTGFFVGVVLLVGALLTRAYAKATWLASGLSAG